MSNRATRKRSTALFGSLVGVVIVAAILIFANALLKPANLRWDRTEGKLYTLSGGTQNILANLDKSVSVRFYFSRDTAEMPVFLKTYAARVEDMLGEFKRAGGRRIELRKLNPQPDSDEADSAVLDGITGQSLDAMGMGDPIYFGIAVSAGGKTAALPFLNPNDEARLEYNLARAVVEVSRDRKARLGVLSSMQVMGENDPKMQMMRMMGQAQGEPKPAWALIDELKRDFDVEEVPADAASIDPAIDTLLVVQAEKLSDATLFALDQFLLRGGRMMVFADPMCITGMQQNRSPYQQEPESDFALEKLLAAWGVRFDADRVIADRRLGTRIRTYSGVETMPTVLSLTKDEISGTDPAMASLHSIQMYIAGSFSGTPADGLKKEILLGSSKEAGQVAKFAAQQSGEALLRDLKPDHRVHELAVKLSGMFPTAFPEGKPGAAAEDTTSLKSSAQPGVVILVGDVDMIHDSFSVRTGNFMGRRISQPINDNLNFVQNMVEQLSGDGNLFEIRTRATASRPFTVVRDMEAEASREFQGKIQQFEAELQQVQAQISELQGKRSGEDRELLSAEQREVLKGYRLKEVEARKDLKIVRRQLRARIDKLENTLIFVNMALMPILVIVAGITVAVIKRKRSASR